MIYGKNPQKKIHPTSSSEKAVNFKQYLRKKSLFFLTPPASSITQKKKCSRLKRHKKYSINAQIKSKYFRQGKLEKFVKKVNIYSSF
jgi:hypothetical protein